MLRQPCGSRFRFRLAGTLIAGTLLRARLGLRTRLLLWTGLGLRLRTGLRLSLRTGLHLRARLLLLTWLELWPRLFLRTRLHFRTRLYLRLIRNPLRLLNRLLHAILRLGRRGLAWLIVRLGSCARRIFSSSLAKSSA